MKSTATAVLIGINVAVFLLLPPQSMAFQMLSLQPLVAQDGVVYFRLWQLVTYAFLHGGLMHILFNMWGLWLFGSEIERYLGSRRLLVLYFASVLSAAAAQMLTPLWVHVEPEPVVGASGGVFGLLLVYAFMFPRRKLIILPIPVPISAWLFATLYAGIELFLGITGAQTNVAHFAHLGGMVGAGALLAYWGRRHTGQQ
ncbi:MAG: rhomboid family intramembrane serine protease [Proteobacteria bacterium]|nr:rhomboid family intramembrane serine protease [Pseudomonadota bacterium]